MDSHAWSLVNPVGNCTYMEGWYLNKVTSSGKRSHLINWKNKSSYMVLERVGDVVSSSALKNSCKTCKGEMLYSCSRHSSLDDWRVGSEYCSHWRYSIVGIDTAKLQSNVAGSPLTFLCINISVCIIQYRSNEYVQIVIAAILVRAALN